MLLYLFKQLIIFKINFNEKIFHNYAFITIISSSVHCVELSFYLITFSLSLKNFLQYLFLCWSAGSDSLNFQFTKFFNHFLKLFIYLLAVSGFVALQTFLQLQQVEVTLQLQCLGFSFRLFLLLKSMGSRARGFSKLQFWAPEAINICSVAQSCLTIYNPMDCSPSGLSFHRISQARILEKVAISSFRGLTVYHHF